MFQPSTSELGSQDPRPERETVIKFVISGPFLNAEAAHAQWSAEPSPSAAMQELVRRIAELERKLDEERVLVQMLSRQMPSTPAPEPVAPPAYQHAPFAGPAPNTMFETATEPVVAPTPRFSFETATEPVVAPGPRFSFETATEPVVGPTPRYSFETATEPVAEPTLLTAVQTMAENAARSMATPSPPPPPLAAVAQTPPPKVRGLRRMIGALRRL